MITYYNIDAVIKHDEDVARTKFEKNIIEFTIHTYFFKILFEKVKIKFRSNNIQRKLFSNNP